MKTKITFELVTPTEVKVLHNGNEVGFVWSENADGTLPYPGNKDHEESKESIQVCGFTDASKIWPCGIFHGTKDVVVRFNQMDDQFHKSQKNDYKHYVETCLKTNNPKLIKTFNDWCAHMGHPNETAMGRYITENKL